MKRILAILLAAVMLLGLCACGKDEKNIASLTEKTEGTETQPESGTEPDKKPDPEPEKEPETDPEPEPEPEPEVEMTTIETELFTVSFPADDGWEYEEDDIENDSDYCSFDGFIFDGDGNRELAVRIYAGLDDPHEYREDLYDRGFDEYALVEENAYADDFYTVGGQQLLKWVNDGGDTMFYFGRNESAGATMFVRVWDDIENERIGRILENLQFHLEEIGNVDGPWYWEGERFSRGEYSTMIGTYTLTSTFLPAADPIITHETFEHDIEIVGDQAYILSDGVLQQYAFDGTGFTYVQDVAAGDGYERIDVSNDGTLLLSDFMKPYIGISDGEMTFSYGGPDYFAAAPDGSWGISYFTTPDSVVRYRFADGAMQTEAFPLTGLSMATKIWIDDSYVYITGSDTETGAQVVQVYDHDGTLQKTLLGKDGRLGSITFVTKTENGFLALDGNMRSVVLWNAEGTYIGEADDRDLFDTSYPWFCSADLQPDGSIVVILTEDRDDNSAMELVAFRLSGF